MKVRAYHLLSGRIFGSERGYAGRRPGRCRGRPGRHHGGHRIARCGRIRFVRKGETLRHRSHQVPCRGTGNQDPPPPHADHQHDRARRHRGPGQAATRSRFSAGSERRRRRSIRYRSRRCISTRWARPIRSPTSWGRRSRWTPLEVETVISSPLNVGSGTVRTEHGLLPVPAPATARLLTGVPVLRARSGAGVDDSHRRGGGGDAGAALRRAAAHEDYGHRLRRGRPRVRRTRQRAARHPGRTDGRG